MITVSKYPRNTREMNTMNDRIRQNQNTRVGKTVQRVTTECTGPAFNPQHLCKGRAQWQTCDPSDPSTHGLGDRDMRILAARSTSELSFRETSSKDKVERNKGRYQIPLPHAYYTPMWAPVHTCAHMHEHTKKIKLWNFDFNKIESNKHVIIQFQISINNGDGIILRFLILLHITPFQTSCENTVRTQYLLTFSLAIILTQATALNLHLCCCLPSCLQAGDTTFAPPSAKVL